MFQSTFGAEKYQTIVFHSEDLLTVFRISKTLHLSLKWAKNDLFARRVVSTEGHSLHIKIQAKIIKEERSLENLIEQPLLLRPGSKVREPNLIKTWIYDKRQIILNFYETKYTFSLYDSNKLMNIKRNVQHIKSSKWAKNE